MGQKHILRCKHADLHKKAFKFVENAVNTYNFLKNLQFIDFKLYTFGFKYFLGN